MNYVPKPQTLKQLAAAAPEREVTMSDEQKALFIEELLRLALYLLRNAMFFPNLSPFQ